MAYEDINASMRYWRGKVNVTHAAEPMDLPTKEAWAEAGIKRYRVTSSEFDDKNIIVYLVTRVYDSDRIPGKRKTRRVWVIPAHDTRQIATAPGKYEAVAIASVMIHENLSPQEAMRVLGIAEWDI